MQSSAPIFFAFLEKKNLQGYARFLTFLTPLCTGIIGVIGLILQPAGAWLLEHSLCGAVTAFGAYLSSSTFLFSRWSSPSFAQSTLCLTTQRGFAFRASTTSAMSGGQVGAGLTPSRLKAGVI